ncbi:flagellar hook-length control protein FliK [Sulfitobacter sp.]|uniref:flagellar hook-length control protein FliK n=1 Tax=Sulfitobacter sp. TaxID=1903071 RepID=UPI003299C229
MNFPTSDTGLAAILTSATADTALPVKAIHPEQGDFAAAFTAIPDASEPVQESTDQAPPPADAAEPESTERPAIEADVKSAPLSTVSTEPEPIAKTAPRPGKVGEPQQVESSEPSSPPPQTLSERLHGLPRQQPAALAEGKVSPAPQQVKMKPVEAPQAAKSYTEERDWTLPVRKTADQPHVLAATAPIAHSEGNPPARSVMPFTEQAQPEFLKTANTTQPETHLPPRNFGEEITKNNATFHDKEIPARQNAPDKPIIAASESVEPLKTATVMAPAKGQSFQPELPADPNPTKAPLADTAAQQPVIQADKLSQKDTSSLLPKAPTEAVEKPQIAKVDSPTQNTIATPNQQTPARQPTGLTFTANADGSATPTQQTTTRQPAGLTLLTNAGGSATPHNPTPAPLLRDNATPAPLQRDKPINATTTIPTPDNARPLRPLIATEPQVKGQTDPSSEQPIAARAELPKQTAPTTASTQSVPAPSTAAPIQTGIVVSQPVQQTTKPQTTATQKPMDAPKAETKTLAPSTANAAPSPQSITPLPTLSQPAAITSAPTGQSIEQQARTEQSISLLAPSEAADLMNWEAAKPQTQQVGQLQPLRADLAPQVARQIAEAMPHAAQRPVEIALSPEELGRVRMSISKDDGAITVNILAERPETLDLMRRHIDQLGQSFRSMGYEQITFAFGQGSDASDQSPPDDAGPQGSGAEARANGSSGDPASAQTTPESLSPLNTTTTGVDIRL